MYVCIPYHNITFMLSDLTVISRFGRNTFNNHFVSFRLIACFHGVGVSLTCVIPSSLIACFQGVGVSGGGLTLV